MRAKQLIMLLAVLFYLLPGCTPPAHGAGMMARIVVEMQLTSPVLTAGEKMPAIYTCDGEDISPPLTWSPVPKRTKSFALVYTNRRGWSYWLLYNNPAEVRELPEAVTPGA